MDAVDRQLIQALRENGRASYAELGRLVGLSGPSVTDRINRLEQAGVITGYRATVAPAALGLGVTALVGLQLSDAADHEDVAERLRTLDEIEDCWFIAGDDSYMLKVRVNDVDGLEATIRRLSGTKGVARTRTTIVLSTKWENRVGALPEEPVGAPLGRKPGE
ncbi:Lrp/AsnC family transcriptional regulator [Streptomyces sp. NRRL F-5123]|uniref:Lrp/AsnC family transcriptional regulator n=1 Tax=Streptomyces sp. NRRL F-5123 TaxID=1463856 RepID=UPI0006939FE7|nr:Lrp/AsnC family transcriptional regulator [Streptomyces sp. NRRL F-5123]